MLVEEPLLIALVLTSPELKCRGFHVFPHKEAAVRPWNSQTQRCWVAPGWQKPSGQRHESPSEKPHYIQQRKCSLKLKHERNGKVLLLLAEEWKGWGHDVDHGVNTEVPWIILGEDLPELKGHYEESRADRDSTCRSLNSLLHLQTFQQCAPDKILCLRAGAIAQR